MCTMNCIGKQLNTEDEILDALANAIASMDRERLEITSFIISSKQYDTIGKKYTNGKKKFVCQSVYGNFTIIRGK